MASHRLSNEENAHFYRVLAIILFLAVCVRLCWLITQTAVIENEGAGYAYTAESLLHGNGLVGTMGPQIMYPPLFSALIAGVSLITRESELGGRLVALIFGTALILPVFFLASKIYGRRTAWISATLIALHPLLIGFSVSVYSEIVYMTLVMAGLYWGFQSLDLERSRDFVLSGACFGLAYLTRPEAIMYPFLTIFAILAVALVKRKSLRRAAFSSLIVLTACFVFVIPYMIFLFHSTGHIRLEGKSNINYVIGQRTNRGMSYAQAGYGISEDLREEGPLLDPNSFARASSFRVSLREIGGYFLVAAKRNVKGLYHTFSDSRPFGSPILAGLIVMGLFRTAWGRDRLIHECFLLMMFLFNLLLILSIHVVFFRYLLPILPFLILWASKGVEEFSEWLVMSAKAINSNFVKDRKWIIQLSVIILLLILPMQSVRGLGELEQGGRASVQLKEAARWLKNYMPRAKKIMDTRAVFPYYAGGTLLEFPYADSRLALRYIHHKTPDFIILDDRTSQTRPYLADWLNNGIPDKDAKLIYTKSNTQGERIFIYQWLVGEISN